MSHERDGRKIDEAAGGREPPGPGGNEDDPSLLRWPEDGVWQQWQRPSRGTFIWTPFVSLVAGFLKAFSHIVHRLMSSTSIGLFNERLVLRYKKYNSRQQPTYSGIRLR